MAHRILVLAAVATVALATLALPVAAQGQTTGIKNPNVSTPTTLYFHLDGIQDFPINTQPPDDRYQKGNPYGLATSTGSCAGGLPTGSGGTTNSYHTYYGYSSPGYVEYDFEEDGGPRYHKERGISFDIKLDTTVQPFVYFYLETQATSADNLAVDPNTAPIVVPQVVVRATLREGADVSVGDESFNSGALVAVGQTAPADLSPQVSHDEVRYSTVNGKHVYEFTIALDYGGPSTIRRDEGYNVRVDVFMENPYCNDPQYQDGDRYLMPNVVRPHTSPDHRPRATLAIMNPLRIEYLHPQFIGDDLVIHTSVNSPWGNYDVKEDGGISIQIEGPSPAISLVQAAFVQRHHEHNHHQEPVDITWVWPYRADGAQDGVYTIKFRVTNDQETAEATGDVQFQIGKGGSSSLPPCEEDVPISEQVNCRVVDHNVNGSKGSPGVGLVALLALLGAAAAVLRRRG